MGVTTNDHLGAAINDIYIKTYLENFFNTHLMYDEAVKTDILIYSGSVARWNRMTNIGKGTELTPGVTPSMTALSTTYVTARLHQLGKLVGLTDVLREDAVQGTVEEAMLQLGESAGETIDDIVIAACFKEQESALEELSAMDISAGLLAAPSNVRTGVAISGTYRGYNINTSGLPRFLTSAFPATGAISALSTIDTEYPVRITDLRFLAKQLKLKNVKPTADGYFHFICNENVATNLKNQDAYQTWNAYTREGQLKNEKGIFGIVDKILLKESNNMFSSTSGVTGTPTYKLEYSILLGKGALGVTQHGGTGKNARGYEIHTVGKKADKADPLGQYGTAGYKVRFGARVLNPSAGAILVSYQ